MTNTPPVARQSPFAWLPFTADELGILHDLCDEVLGAVGMDHKDSTKLNALRTLFAEQKDGLERLQR